MSSILKWSLNRAAQSKNTEALYTLAGVHHSDTIYKSTRPSEILKSEKYVTSVIRALTEEYINPFGDDLDKESLFNLSSGLQGDIELAKRILDNINVGNKCYKDFIYNRLESENENIHNPLKVTTHLQTYFLKGLLYRKTINGYLKEMISNFKF